MIKNSIPFVDLLGKTPIDLLRTYPDKAHDLVRASVGTYGLASRLASIMALPWADKKSHAWLKSSYNPYLYEIESFADILDMAGVYALNLSYEWSCTSGAYRTDETVSLLRVLDWPFPALGKHVVVALQSGKAGDFYNITWPAMAGVYTAMAPGRFSASINQAPMRDHGLGYGRDWLKNRALFKKESGLPPSHLLRRVFEQAQNYTEAKRLLTETPIAIPAIFTLTGVMQGEGSVIERLEHSAQVMELGAGQQLATSNHFNGDFAGEGKGWRPREIDSHGRYKQSCTIHGYDLSARNFDWLRAPIININTRLCVIADAATRRVTVQGFEGAVSVTDIFDLPAETQEM